MANDKTRARTIANSLNSTSLFSTWSRVKRESFLMPKVKKAAPIEGPEGKGFVGAARFADYG
jgi:hypothetical protein